MRAGPLAALLRLLLLAGGANFVNPYTSEERTDLSQVWVEIPTTLVALGGDVHIQVHGAVGPGLRVRLAREDDEGRILLATLPLALDAESRATLPCGYFSRGGVYYLELIADKDTFLTDYDNNTDTFDLKNGFDKRDADDDKTYDGTGDKGDKSESIDDRNKESDTKVKRSVNDAGDEAFDGEVNKSDANVQRASESDGRRNKVTGDRVVKGSVDDSRSMDTGDSVGKDERKNKESETRVKRVKRDDVETGDTKVNRNVRRDADDGSIMDTGDSVVKTWKFDVLWPSASLDVTPEQIQTYPERQVTAILEFPRVVCSPVESSADFWLELLYCGHSSGGAVLCDGKNTSSHAHVLYSEQMHGFPGRRTMTLRCELFGQAGDYALTLRPAAATGPQDLATSFIKADWSEQFVLNVHGGSVFPCGDGVKVLFQYPECVLEGADRVRVFGRDNDRLRYVAERRVRRGQHTASFDCRLFSERYPEYCFVYVSQAVTGAVADVRMDCLPTLAMTAGGAGGWGEWSPWSACPAPRHCSTRTRSRHRFCDSPPPAYGAKYCEGQAVELAACECTAIPWAGDSSVVTAEVGSRCRCGCILHLAPAPRLLAGSLRACQLRSFWLLQAEEGLVVRLRMESVKLPCAGQWLKVRDGDSLGSPLLASWDGPDTTAANGGDVEPTAESGGATEIAGGGRVLIELMSGDGGERCAGGFLGHASQVEAIRNASVAWARSGLWLGGGGGARGACAALAGAAALAALALALLSARRGRAYQRAADKEDLTDSDACSLSLALGAAGSRSTLLSELAAGGVALRRLLPPAASRARGQGSRDAEEDEEEAPSDAEQDNDSEASAESEASEASQATVTPETVSASSAPAGVRAGGACAQPAPLRRSRTVSATNVTVAQTLAKPPPQPAAVSKEPVTVDMTQSISSASEITDSEKDRDSAWEKDRSESRASSSTSAATLTNGWYSPALSGVASARIRDNAKQTKESCNRRLLRSDLSLTSHPEMEIDYYDYEVNNAGSVPGSYLGMDPAFLVWIPPIEDGDIIKEMDENDTDAPIYEEILPKGLLPDPGSNTESPEELPSSSTLKRTDNRFKRSNESVRSYRRERGNIIHPLNFSISDLQNPTKVSRRNRKKKVESPVGIPMKELTLTRSPVKIHRNKNEDSSTLKRINDNARETKDKDTLKRSDFADLKFADENSDSSNDIKFADDSSPDSNRISDRYDVKV